MRISKEVKEFLSKIGEIGGSSASDAKKAAAAENGKRPVKPGSKPRGRPKGPIGKDTPEKKWMREYQRARRKKHAKKRQAEQKT